MSWLGRLRWRWLVPLALFAALAPWPAGPEPHLIEKLRWFSEGRLTRPLDIFDVVFHLGPTLLLVLKGVAARNGFGGQESLDDELAEPRDVDHGA